MNVHQTPDPFDSPPDNLVIRCKSVFDAADWPLVVDLDGTLTPTDTLVESIIQIVKKDVVNLVRLPIWLFKGRLAFKDKIASRSDFSARDLPYRASLIDYLVAEKNRGRKIILATAAHRSIALRVSEHLGLFDHVLATGSGCNLKGQAKLECIQNHIGEKFVYAGDSRADLPIWMAAQAAILAGVSPRLAAHVRDNVLIEREFPNEKIGIRVWSKALRIHQWLKNLLLFVPLLTAFSFFDTEKLLTLAIAFFSMSLGASATYIANDIWDLDHDRAHPAKRLRPFANGTLSISSGIICAAMLLVASLTLALAASNKFAMMLVLYLILTTLYSWFLKALVLVDVIMLSLLYTLRILAGSVAIQIETSQWLLAFSVFMFLSLALVKRCAELVLLRRHGKPATMGRDYQVDDLEVLWSFGIGAALSAVVVFGLFVNAPETALRYASPALLWFVAIGLIYLLARLWIKTVRGEMNDDPVIYVIGDRGSQLTVLGIVAIMMAAHFFTL